MTLSRLQAKVFRDVLRHSLLPLDPDGEFPLMLIRTIPEGTFLEAQKNDLAVRWHLPEKQPTAELAFRSTVLAAIEGRTNEPVALDPITPDRWKATWQEKGGIQVFEFDTVTPDSVPPFPAFPPKMHSTDPRLLVALGEAARTIAKDHVRYALSKIQLRGGKVGQVVATDGRQLFVHRGFRFPWTGDVLVCSVPAFTKPNLFLMAPGRIGRTDTHVVWQFGPWTFAFRIDPTARYPEVNNAIPDLNGYTSRLVLDPGDADLLRKAIPKLPGRSDENSPILLDLERGVVIVEGSEDHPTSQIELIRSQRNGKFLRVRSNRQYLLRALDLGFREFRFGTEKTAIVCQDQERLYLWIPLANGNSEPVPTPAKAEASVTAIAPIPHLVEVRRPPVMPDDSRNGHTERAPVTPPTLEDLIAEAEEMRRGVGEIGTRLSRWIAALKQQRRHTRVFRQAISSIKQIDLDG
jgi:hypothetical protein